MRRALASRLVPIRQFLVRPPPAVADQRRVVAEAALDHPIRQFDRRVEMIGIGEAIEQEVGLLVLRREIVARERIDVSTRSEHAGLHA